MIDLDFDAISDNTILYRYHHIEGVEKILKKKLMIFHNSIYRDSWFLTIHEAKITHFLIIRSVIEEDIIKRETGIRKNDQFSGYLYSLNQLKNTKKDIDNYALLYPEEFL